MYDVNQLLGCCWPDTQVRRLIYLMLCHQLWISSRIAPPMRPTPSAASSASPDRRPMCAHMYDCVGVRLGDIIKHHWPYPSGAIHIRLVAVRIPTVTESSPGFMHNSALNPSGGSPEPSAGRASDSEAAEELR